MRSPLPALQAFAQDARSIASDDARADRLAEWLAVAKAAERLSALAVDERASYLEALSGDLLPADGTRPTQRDDTTGPPQDPTARLAERLRFAAEQMERGGCFELAYATVSAVCSMTHASARASRLLATMQLGRIARQLGDLDAATDCYEKVSTVALHERDGPLAAFGFIGLGNVARNRGNRPAERQLFERALSLAHPGGSMELAASLGLMNVAMSEDRHVDALLHGWRAFDLAGGSADDQAGILTNIALTSLRADFAEAALKGLRHALSLTSTPRLRVSAHGGAIRAAARLRRRDEVERSDRDGERDAERAGIPFETARFCMFAGEAWLMLDEIERARVRLEGSLALASRFGFHEVAMSAENVLDALRRRERARDRARPWQPADSGVAGDVDRALLVEAGIGRLDALAG